MLTRRCGCAGGCASSTKSGGEGAGVIHSRTSTGLRARTPEPPWARRAVDEGVRSCPRAGCGKSARPVVCPAKAGMFSRRKACRGKSQKPRSLDSRVAGNQDSEAYRQRLPREDDESPGRNDSERKSGLESAWPRRPSPQIELGRVLTKRLAD